MNAPQVDDDWASANQRHLMAALALVRGALERHAGRAADKPSTEANETSELAQQRLPQAAAPQGAYALDTLCETFALSPFERDVLLLCAGTELDGGFADLCAGAQGNSRRTYPTFSLALAALPHAHWSAITPAAPLRRWRLIEIAQSGDSITQSPLRIDERVLHYLAGVSYLDERLRGIVAPVSTSSLLPPSHQQLAQRLAAFWRAARARSEWPISFLGGVDQTGKRAVATAASATLGLMLHVIRAADLPTSAAEREALIRLWEREAALQTSALLVEQDDSEITSHALLTFIENLRGVIFVAGRDSPRARERAVFRVDVQKPSAEEQQQLWRATLGPLAKQLNGQLAPIAAQFSMSAEGIQAAGVQAREALTRNGNETSRVALWDACRLQARPSLDDLAQRIEPAARWDDLVLPEYQTQTLREIASQVKQRAKVYEYWGFARKGTRGLGISALFAGASGTGKTLAAEVLANELLLDLYRIDLSQVVSKYIGETEKNLRRVFDAAEEGGAVLLFDEADALFGKRSEVKDSHDRYANVEVSYLLQRMETYRGLAVLTTNMKSALDSAFLRRIRFIVQFPFPDVAQRAEIWRRVFPSSTPTENLDTDKLARLNVPGGSIRNIALNAAFLAADSEQPVTMPHLLRAARAEYGKFEKPLTETETGGWV